jgi:hypothetical protein
VHAFKKDGHRRRDPADLQGPHGLLMDGFACHTTCPQSPFEIIELSEARRSIHTCSDVGALSCDRQVAGMGRTVQHSSWFAVSGAAGWHIPTEPPGSRRCGYRLGGLAGFTSSCCRKKNRYNCRKDSPSHVRFRRGRGGPQSRGAGLHATVCAETVVSGLSS